MVTRLLTISSSEDTEKIEEAAKLLREDGLVAFPTETVYGIGANALKPEVVARIYEAKGRPSDNPLIVHIGEADWVERYAKDISPVARTLMAAFWPGPLTLIFKKKAIIPKEITGGLDTVAIRLPAHPIAKAIIKASDLPIAAPSANRSGRPSPTKAEHVMEDLHGRIEMVVDGGLADIGLESTVLDLTGDVPMILRPGGITRSMLEEVIGQVAVDAHLKNLDEKEIPRSPGMKYRHYAPRGEMTVYRGHCDYVIEAINDQAIKDQEQGLKVGIIATKENSEAYKGDTVLVIGSKNDPQEIAANLFDVLRKMDTLDMDRIYSEAFIEEELSVATMNRLLKAAGNRVVDLEDGIE